MGSGNRRPGGCCCLWSHLNADNAPRGSCCFKPLHLSSCCSLCLKCLSSLSQHSEVWPILQDPAFLCLLQKSFPDTPSLTPHTSLGCGSSSGLTRHPSQAHLCCCTSRSLRNLLCVHTSPQQTYYIWKTQRNLPYKVTACAFLINWKVRQTTSLLGSNKP